MKKKFKRHFRIYFKNNHPAYIVDEEGNCYVFHRVTHSKTSGGRKNWEISPNPIKGERTPMYIVKQEKRDLKGRFSLFEIELKKGVNVTFSYIKKVGRTQANQQDGHATITSDNRIAGRSQKLITSNQNVNNSCPSTNIKANRKNKGKKNK